MSQDDPPQRDDPRQENHDVPAAPRGEPAAMQRIDALMPAEMAEYAELRGAEKTRMDALSLFCLSVLAGAFIALGVWFGATLAAGPGLPFGIQRLLGGVGLAMAFVLVLVGGAELFTSNNLMVMAWASRRVRLLELLRAWAIVYIGNLVGTVATGAMILLAGEAAAGGGHVAGRILAAAADRAELGTVEAFFLAILGNLVVCMAAWVSYSARTSTDRVVVVMLPIMAFSAMALEHVVAAMAYFPLALLILWSEPASLFAALEAGPEAFSGVTAGAFLRHLVPVTIGNVIGGGVLVGAAYWFIYMRPKARRPR